MKHYILQAINVAGKSVYIDDVPNGKKCGCVCKECKGELVAKNGGKIKAHHFAHASGTDSFKCSQTALHLLAKEIIAEERRVPAFVDGNITFVSVASVEQEKNLGDIRPDLYAEHDRKPLAVEIYVFHAVDDAKIAKIQERRLTTFEINLSELDFETKDDVRRAIYDVKNLKLIYDEGLYGTWLAWKKQILVEQGILKPIINGVVRQCHMYTLLINGRFVKSRDVPKSFCRNCFFGCYSEDNNSVHCVGHTNGQIPLWFLQVNVNENRIMSLAETQEKLNSFIRAGKKTVL